MKENVVAEYKVAPKYPNSERVKGFVVSYCVDEESAKCEAFNLSRWTRSKWIVVKLNTEEVS